MQQGIDQGASLVSGGRMDHHAGGFVDDDQVPVLVKNVQGDLFGRGFSRSGGGRRTVSLSSPEPEPRLGRRPRRAAPGLRR